MKVKIFMDSRVDRLEQEINNWFESSIGGDQIIKMETVIAPVEEKTGDGSFPCIVVTIWYEPPSN